MLNVYGFSHRPIGSVASRTACHDAATAKGQAVGEGHLELSDPLSSAIAAAATSSSVLLGLPPKMKLPDVSTLAPAATHACAVAALTPPST